MGRALNRRGDFLPILPWLLLILFIAAVAVLFTIVAIKFEPVNEGEAIGLRQRAASYAIQRADLALLFLDNAAERAGEQALWLLGANGGFDLGLQGDDEAPCGRYLYPLWSDASRTCLPDVNESFANLTAKALRLHLDTQAMLPYTGYDLRLTRADPAQLVGIADEQATIEITLHADGADEEGGGGGLAGYALPLVGDITITSCWGERSLSGSADWHDGIDLVSSERTGLVTAIADGEVVYACSDWNAANGCACSVADGSCPARCSELCSAYGRNYGNVVIIKHDNGLYSQYSHLAKARALTPGDRIRRNQGIGFFGNTGHSLGDHLDLKVFLREEDIGTDKGINPLCLFTYEQLERISRGASAQSCTKYHAFNHDDAQLGRECASIPKDRLSYAAAPSPDAGVSIGADARVEGLSDAQQARITATRERLERIGMDHVIETIGRYSAAHGFDTLPVSLVLAIITTESTGDIDAGRSSGGPDHGLMQINQGSSFTICRESSVCSIDAIDDLYDWEQNICCGLAILKQKRDLTRGITPDELRGVCEPSSAHYTRYLSYTDWQETLRRYNGLSCKSGNPHYVEEVWPYISAWGGDFAAATGGERSVDETPLGTLSFDAAFTLDTRYNLSVYDALGTWTEQTITECANQEGEAIERCVEQRIRDAPVPLEQGPCEEGGEGALERVAAELLDCLHHEASECVCLGEARRGHGDLATARIALSPKGNLSLLDEDGNATQTIPLEHAILYAEHEQARAREAELVLTSDALLRGDTRLWGVGGSLRVFKRSALDGGVQLVLIEGLAGCAAGASGEEALCPVGEAYNGSLLAPEEYEANLADSEPEEALKVCGLAKRRFQLCARTDPIVHLNASGGLVIEPVEIRLSLEIGPKNI